MKKIDEKEYKIWLDKASDDLNWTKSNIKQKVYYGACFTAQQSAEKALKAFLLFKKGRFEKVHDLVKLLNTCATNNKEFIRFKTKVAKLSFYYIQSRYPDISELDIFTAAQAQEAYEIAENIFQFVSEKIRNK